jgi:hypothetical protein
LAVSQSGVELSLSYGFRGSFRVTAVEFKECFETPAGIRRARGEFSQLLADAWTDQDVK